MLILVGVTVNVALNGSLFKSANQASLEQERHSILERIIAMSEYTENGSINVQKTYSKVKKEFTVPQEKMNTSKTEVKFKIQGKYGIYGYKITEAEINFDDSNLDSQTPVASEPGSFTFNEINNFIIEYIKAEAPDTATDDEIKQQLLSAIGGKDGLLSIQQMGANATVSIFEFPSKFFWNIVGKSYAGQYGIVGEGNSLEEGFALRNSDNIITTDSNEFSEYYTGSTNTSTNIFSFTDGSDRVAFYLSKTGTEFSAIVSADGKDSEGNESESIMSWDEFLEAYGNIKFTFSKAQGSQNPEQKESYSVSEYFSNLTSKEDISYIYKGETYTNTLTANDGYALPETIDVEIGGETATEGTDYTWEITTDETTGEIIGKIEIPNVTGQLSISAEGTYNIVSIFYNTDAIDTDNLPNQTTKGATFSCVFKASEGYVLPETIEVTMNGEALTAGIDYTWDPSTGKLETTINVTGDINVNISAEANLVYVSYNLSNIDESSSNLVYEATRRKSFSCTFKVNEGYDLPETIEVTMNGQTLTATTDYTWDSSIGTLEIANVTGDIVITIPKGLIGSEITLDADQDGIEETWIVLYKENDYIEVISKNTMGSVTLGEDDPEAMENATDINKNGTLEDVEKAIYSYNNAIDRINNYCASLIKIDNLGVRSVGSKPSEPSYRNTTIPSAKAKSEAESWSNKTAWETYGILAEDEDENYLADYEQMNILGITDSEDQEIYWLASRLVDVQEKDGYTYFSVRWTLGVTLRSYGLYSVAYDGRARGGSDYDTFPVRPLIKLQYP